MSIVCDTKMIRPYGKYSIQQCRFFGDKIKASGGAEGYDIV